MLIPETATALAELERVYQSHPDMQIRNLDRLQTCQHRHTRALCKAIAALGKAFQDKKLYVLVEAEISEQGKRAQPEDIVAWVEDHGVFVVEVKSHNIDGIQSFENNVPQVMYRGERISDKDLLDQPMHFAYALKGSMDKLFDQLDIELPALYFAGWLPNVSQDDLLSRQQKVKDDKVWLSDMRDRDTFLKRLTIMKNITRSKNNGRETLEPFCKLFGSTSGLFKAQPNRSTELGSLGHLIDRKNTQLKRLTKEQEDLAFSPLLTRGPKVIRGVAGSGKTIVLANAVAETILREQSRFATQTSLLEETKKHNHCRILVICFNRALVPYLEKLIYGCFDSRKPSANHSIVAGTLNITNIDRLGFSLAGKNGYDINHIAHTVDAALANQGAHNSYDYCFIDEGQDIDPEWYRLICTLIRNRHEVGRSIVVFYDDAQNIYGIRRPGKPGEPTWESLLGTVPNPRNLKTVMRMGHRNTNQILSFSFSMLLGGYAQNDPKMATFADLNDYTKEIIPEDPAIDHPNAGQPCVVKLDQRIYKINFSVSNGAPPHIHCCVNEEEMLNSLADTVIKHLHPDGGNVQPHDILIMAPNKKHVRKIAAILNSSQIPVHIPLSLDGNDLRDKGCFVDGSVTVTTIMSSKGYTAHVCHLAYAESLECSNGDLKKSQEARAQFHVACTRSSLILDIWGLPCPLMVEATQAAEAVTSHS
jgi:superfamily I DNA and RNA helicase